VGGRSSLSYRPDGAGGGCYWGNAWPHCRPKSRGGADDPSRKEEARGADVSSQGSAKGRDAENAPSGLQVIRG